MKTIKEIITNIYEIEKSKFISIIITINNKEDVDIELRKIKDKWEDANHYCYAYIVDEFKKSSDDGEPGGTAGVPMMEVLNQNELINIIAITVRYFGGIKLGAGGLVRAYRKSITECLNNNKNKIIEITDGYLIKLEAPYDKQKDIEKQFKRIIHKDYGENITYQIELTTDEYELLKDKYKLEIIKNKKIEI
jgi:uncharacterized YigZ family protein